MVEGPVAVSVTAEASKVPPLLLTTFFVSVSEGSFVLVKVHARFAPDAVAVVFKTSVAVVAVAAGLKVTFAAAVPVQTPDVATHPAGMVSVRVVATAFFRRILVAPETAVPATVVVIVSVPKPLLPLKENAPMPPLVTFESVTRADFNKG